METMNINPNIFKAYDIRGKFPEEVNPEIAEKIGRAAAEFLSQKLRKKKLTFLVCRDVRDSSPALKEAAARGILAQGSDVIDVGIGTTPFFYFLMHTEDADGGIMVTASHNPAQYNGFKIRGKGGKAIGSGSGLEDIRGIALKKENKEEEKEGILLPVRQNYKEKYIKFISRNIFISSKISIVIDASGGSTAFFLPELLNRFPNIVYKPLFFEPDGFFRHHPPNPLLEDAQKHLRQELKSGKFRFGAIFDGDGDRVVFLDENGRAIRQDFISALLADKELENNKGATFVLTVNTSNGVREFIREQGGKVKLSKVGYTNVERAMRKSNAFLGVELSGKLFFRDFFFDESGLLAFLRLTQILASSPRSLSQLIRPLERYVTSPEINFEVEDKSSIITKIRKYYQKAKISALDGLTVEFPDWWFNIRPSNTEPLIRLVLEAKNQKLFDEKLLELKKLLAVSS